MERFEHGGDIYRNKVKYDFSANINPLGMPERVKGAIRDGIITCQVYPDPNCGRLKGAVSAMENIPRENLIFGNGASELIDAFVRTVKPGKVMTLAPAFSGYEKAAKAYGAKLVYFPLHAEEDYRLKANIIKEIEKERPGLLFLCNPNNPTGTLITPKLLEGIADTCARLETYLLMDECFLRFSPEFKERTMRKKIFQYDNLFVIDAFTKFYALPGLRLGYGMSGNTELLENLKWQLPEWNISALAQIGGIYASLETYYAERTREYVEEEKRYLGDVLRALGMKVYDSAANFIFMYSNKPIYTLLLKEGILIRSCQNYMGLSSGYYRIAVRTHEENKVLAETLQRVI